MNSQFGINAYVFKTKSSEIEKYSGFQGADRWAVGLVTSLITAKEVTIADD